MTKKKHATTESHGDSPSAEHSHGPEFYVKIWALLVVLLIASVLGPMAEIQWLTLMTAFGIALVKAYLVAKNFMHLNTEKKYVSYLLVTAVAFIVLFFFGVAADIMQHSGEHWDNRAAKTEVDRAIAAREDDHADDQGQDEQGQDDHGSASHHH